MSSVTTANRNLPPEWNGIIPTDYFMKEALRIVDKSKERGLTLRLMGGIGIALKSASETEFSQRLGRSVMGKQEYTDLDFMGLTKERGKIQSLFEKDLKYPKRRVTMSSAESQRQIFYHPQGYFTVDVMMDKLLIANHPINLQQRLSIDPVTLSLTDLLLEKIQMWEAFSEKDLKDCMLLLKAHPVSLGQNNPEAIDADYIAKLLSDDWGFYYTATTNLKKIKSITEQLDTMGKDVRIPAENVSQAERQFITSRIDELLTEIEKRPKSMGWQMRAKLGTTKKWYKPVETAETVGDFGIWKLRDLSEGSS